MKTTKISLSLALIMVAGALTFSSCKKKETTTPATDNEQSTAADNNLAENTSNDAVSMGSQVSENGGLTTFRSSDPNVNANNSGIELMLASTCTTISPTMTGSVITGYTVNFGATACVCADGKSRSGMIVYDFTGSPVGSHYRTPGFTMKVSSQNYVVDGNAVTVTKTVTNTSPESIAGETAYSGTNLTWNIVANLTIVKANNGGTITWNSTRTKTLINSNDPTCYKGQQQAIDWTKAKISLTGNGSGTNNKGETYTISATNLERDFTCSPDPLHIHHHPFVSGVVDYTPGTRAERVIDFGNGSCDLNATVTIKGQTFTITLP